MKVIAYTNSFTTSENVKITTVRIPGTETGNTMRTSAPNLEHPSISAASSSSCGIDLKNPIRSQIANGIVNDGYTTINAHRRSSRLSFDTTRESGRKSSVGGTRYVRKMATPRLRPTRPESRASAYPAGTATASVISTTAIPTTHELRTHRRYPVWWKR